MERELSEMDIRLMSSSIPDESADIYRDYENLKLRLNKEMESWALYSHEVDEFIKSSSNGFEQT